MKFLSIHKKITTAVDIGTDWLKLVQVEESSKGKKVTKLATQKISSQSDEVISKIIKEFFNELKIKSDSVVILIPRHLVTVRFLRLPSTDEKEIKGMVSIQAVRQIPYPKEEIITDYQIIGTDGEYSKVLLVIVHQDVVNRWLKILKNAGIEPQFIILSSLSLCNWYLFGKPTRPYTRSVAIIDVDFTTTDIAILSGCDLAFTRSIPFGAIHLVDQEVTLTGDRDKFIEEIRRSFTTYAEEGMDKRVNEIVLTGISPPPKGLDKTLESEFSLAVNVVAPLANVGVEEEVLKSQYEKNISLSAIIGLALDGNLTKINLLPPQLKMKLQWQARRGDLILTGVLLVAILVSGLAIFANNIYDKQRYLRELNIQLEKTTPLAKEVEQMMKKVEIIKDQMDFEGTSLDILRELYKIIPKEIKLTVFNFDVGQLVTLQGTSQNMSDVFKFITILEESPYFKNIQIRYASRRKVKDKELTDFQIRCLLQTQINTENIIQK